MIVPGSNNLALALSIQGKEKINYFRAEGRTVSARGRYVSAYSIPFPIYGRFQAEQRTAIAQEGQELQKSIGTIYLSTDMVDVRRNTQGDQVSYGGRYWQLLSNLEWNNQDGWASAMVADQGEDPNLYFETGLFQNPGITPITYSNIAPASPGAVVIDVQKWTLGAGTVFPVTLSGGFVDGTVFNLKLLFNNQLLVDVDQAASGGQVQFPVSGTGMTNCCLRIVIIPTVYDAPAVPFDITLSNGV